MGTAPIHVPKNVQAGPWSSLLQHAFTILDDLKQHGGIQNPFWTLGGGTVLMLRHQHRLSKDIDIFVPDPQYLGFVTPRLSDVAAKVAQDYVEAAGYVKLIRAEGEIDFVAAQNLTHQPYEVWSLLGRNVKVETSAEIIAKKLWHRGDAATARDLFDLSLVIEKEPHALKSAAPYLVKHRASFLHQLATRRHIFELQFDAIDRLQHRPSFSEALALSKDFLSQL